MVNKILIILLLLAGLSQGAWAFGSDERCPIVLPLLSAHGMLLKILTKDNPMVQRFQKDCAAGAAGIGLPCVYKVQETHTDRVMVECGPYLDEAPKRQIQGPAQSQ